MYMKIICLNHNQPARGLFMSTIYLCTGIATVAFVSVASSARHNCVTVFT